MKTINKELVIEQLDSKLGQLKTLAAIGAPQRGWIRAIRNALNMNCRQLAKRLGLKNRSSVTLLEQSEISGTATINTLRHAAEALDCVFVYGLVPRSSLKETVRKRAENTARQKTAKTSHTMLLEAQQLTKEEEEKAIRHMVDDLIKNMPRTLWD